VNQSPMQTLPAVYSHHQSLLEKNATTDPGVQLVQLNCASSPVNSYCPQTRDRTQVSGGSLCRLRTLSSIRYYCKIAGLAD